jgi:pimeloyl-ACP methyl ester carboxylesterase
VNKQIKNNSYFSGQLLVDYTKAMQTQLPILFSTDTQKQTLTYQNRQKKCYLLKISYIHILNECGHLGMLEQRELFNKAIEDYLEAVN